ncbi:hypothetical protein MIMGU_mgv1a017553mg [Erythranthe guttata]|uniref:Uncharacterized protein n=1 Tax=Erythranthe guttata TaxID=4155 RepID=A0A022QXU2_ERYGU|nr:hypothetical protein MIMGU_mgv1a017553mg [Erythranthe guttata]
MVSNEKCHLETLSIIYLSNLDEAKLRFNMCYIRSCILITINTRWCKNPTALSHLISILLTKTHYKLY